VEQGRLHSLLNIRGFGIEPGAFQNFMGGGRHRYQYCDTSQTTSTLSLDLNSRERQTDNKILAIQDLNSWESECRFGKSMEKLPAFPLDTQQNRTLHSAVKKLSEVQDFCKTWLITTACIRSAGSLLLHFPSLSWSLAD